MCHGVWFARWLFHPDCGVDVERMGGKTIRKVLHSYVKLSSQKSDHQKEKCKATLNYESIIYNFTDY